MLKKIPILLCFAYIMFSCKQQQAEVLTEEVVEIDSVTSISQPKEMVYGLPAHKYEVIKKQVKSNHNLASMLFETGLDAQAVQTLINHSEKVFDSRKIKKGNTYALLSSTTNSTPYSYFIYEIDKLNYLRYILTDSLYVEQVAKKTEILRKYASVGINSSLWVSMTENNLDPMLAVELSEIYAWTIDFFGLQKGDSIRLDYDEMYVDGERVGLNKIYSACFKHQNHDYFAIAFNQDGKEGYFDLEGNSLKKAFLKAPLRFSRISSKFSNSRLHPILKIYRPHHGIDYAAPIGTPVQTIGDGVVLSVSHTGGAGRMVKIKHNSVYTTAYLHLHNFGKGITKGARVTQGQIIGYVGSSGLSTGPHLDFRVYKNGTAVDPLKIESPPVEPVLPKYKPAYNEFIYFSLQQLGLNKERLLFTPAMDELMANTD